MTLIKWSNGRSNGNSAPSYQSNPFFNSRSIIDAFNPFESVKFLQNFFEDELGINSTSIGRSMPAVNISENDNALMFELAAPGMKKKDFGIEFHEGQLRISYKHEDQTEQKEEKNPKSVLRREYHFKSFERTFNLPETIDGENITASYEDGILKISVPKKEESKKPLKNIEVK
jgi:HSP20 family protein